MQTVREFVTQSYRLISASSPTTPLHGSDLADGIRILNQLFRSYASSGLMITIAKTVSVAINSPVKEIHFTDPDYPLELVQTEAVTLTATSADFTVSDSSKYMVGDVVTGNGIPASTTIAGIAGNVITISQNATISGISTLTFTRDLRDPTVAYIQEGRLANLDSAWLLLEGVTYPLKDESRNKFLGAWKYEPLQSLPRFIITFPQTAITVAQLYPAPSQGYQFFARGKFQLPSLTSNDDMSIVPEYYHLYFSYAVAKYLSKYKGRSAAWTPDLEEEYRELKLNMESASEVNLSIQGDTDSLLNGANRLRAGV